MKNLLFTVFGISLIILMPIVLIHVAYETPPWFFWPIFALWVGAMTVAAIVWTTKAGVFRELWGENKVAEPRYRSPQYSGTQTWETKTTYSVPVTKEEAEVLERIKKRTVESAKTKTKTKTKEK